MQAQGVELVKHYRDLAFMGFAEVVANLRTIMKNIAFCKEDISAWKPDAVILIDYPGFNFRIAEYAHGLDVKVLYYISPQLWAWKENRVKKVRKYIDRMYCILPFEKEFYAGHDIDVDFVGHPLLDAIEEHRTNAPELSVFLNEEGLDDRPIIAVLPGSRKQEITVKLPIMLSVIDEFPDHQFVVGGAPSVPDEFYAPYLNDQVKLVKNRTYDLLHHAHSAMVTSGTATLEAGLFGVPLVVCYKGGQISYQIAKRLVKVDYISLVNLIMEQEVVKELIQNDLNTKNLVEELRKITVEGMDRDRVMDGLKELENKLGGPGASAHTAELMLKTLK